MSSPDLTGLLRALATLPTSTPEQRRAYRLASSAHTASTAMRTGHRWRTRSLPRPRTPHLRERWRSQPRDPASDRWCRT